MKQTFWNNDTVFDEVTICTLKLSQSRGSNHKTYMDGAPGEEDVKYISGC